ncbi:hypothetical protein F6P94_01810 [Escherichia coli]|nr:hypothetical protein F6P94_01810 [Escherichia coli]
MIDAAQPRPAVSPLFRSLSAVFSVLVACCQPIRPPLAHLSRIGNYGIDPCAFIRTMRNHAISVPPGMAP